MRLLSALALAAMMFTTASLAQHSHGNQKGPNGGPVEDIAGVHAELIIEKSQITFYILDEANKPVDAKGYSGSALVVVGAAKETVTLTVAGSNTLKGELKQPVIGEASVTLLLKTAGGKSGQARYKAKSK